MKGFVKRYCVCRDDTGKMLGTTCPGLATSKHGQWEFRDKLKTSAGYRELRRRGLRTRTDAEAFQKAVRQLVDLAAGDERVERRIGDLVFERTRKKGALPPVEEIRRRLGAGVDVNTPSMSVTDFAEEWLSGKRALKASVARLYRQHVDHYIGPILGDIAVDRLRAEQVSGMFDLIEEWNSEIVDARAAKRRPRLPGDVRRRSGVVGLTTQHRILDTLRNMMNAAVKPPRRFIDFNPCLGVELPPADEYEARVWAPEQVAHFLDSTQDDRLGLLFRVVLLRGLRRGEACGLPWSHLDIEQDAGRARIEQTLLQLGGRLVWDTPKSRKSKRVVTLDAGTVAELRALRKRAKRERLALGEVYVDHGLVFCREDGAPYSPDYVSRRFKELAEAAGLPVIRLHEGRHTAATLALEGGVDIKLVSEQLGHVKTAFTRDVYQHVRLALQDQAAETVVNLLPKSARESKRSGA